MIELPCGNIKRGPLGHPQTGGLIRKIIEVNGDVPTMLDDTGGYIPIAVCPDISGALRCHGTWGLHVPRSKTWRLKNSRPDPAGEHLEIAWESKEETWSNGNS
jgi:hypothetical protein